MYEIMTNILIVCIQGLTSGILAGKLNQTAEKNREEYRFLSAGIAEAEKHLDWADYVILTPQVKDRTHSLQENARQNQAVCLTLADTMISFQNIQETYGNITSAIEPEKPGTDRYRIILIHCALTACIVALSGGVSYLIGRFSGIELFQEFYIRTLGMICLYCSLDLGYRIFEENRENGMTGFLVSLMILLSLTPFVRIDGDPRFNLYLTHMAVDMSYWSVRYLPWFLLMELLFLNASVYLFRIAASLRMKQGKLSDRNNTIFMLAPMTILMVLLILTRIIFLPFIV